MNPNSILAMLAEIEANPLRGLIEPDEKREALAIIEHIERRLSEQSPNSLIVSNSRSYG